MNAITWLLQRVSGALLIVLLGLHIWLLFIVNPAEIIQFDEARARLATGAYVALYALLLLFGFFHAFNGLYNVMVDMGLKARITTISILVVLGVGLFGVGLYSVTQFILK